MFPKKYEEYRRYLEVDNKVFVYGRASITEKEGKLLLEKMISFGEVPKKIYIQLDNRKQYDADEQELYEMVDRYPGSSEVIVVLKEEKMMKPLGRQFLISSDDMVISAFKKRFGEGKVIIKESKVSF